MALYAIGDLHLGLRVNKPMDVFGPGWANHVERLRGRLFQLEDDDVTVLCGDTSWGIDFAQSLADFRLIDSFPGKKLLLKGNHDYWWTTAAKMRRFFSDNGLTTLDILHNNCHSYGDWALCGTRGWFYEEEQTGHNEKVFNREVIRLEASLKAAGGRPILAFLHYPPLYTGYRCPEILPSWRRTAWSAAATATSTAPPTAGPSRGRWARWTTAWCPPITCGLFPKKSVN